MGKIGNIFKEGELDKDTSVEIFDRSENKASRSRHGLAEIRWQNIIILTIMIAESNPEEKERKTTARWLPELI